MVQLLLVSANFIPDGFVLTGIKVCRKKNNGKILNDGKLKKGRLFSDRRAARKMKLKSPGHGPGLFKYYLFEDLILVCLASAGF
ncbi:MAG: hypothetical protein HYZ14_07165 [Bacteroidetes bacterium]|nr:hypothetical protein [Bacteroidota bacterium]